MPHFAAYIGAMENNVKFSDVPVDDKVEFHFILSFAIDYDNSRQPNSPKPTYGKFGVHWDDETLTPEKVAAFKSKHRNVKFALSVGGDSIDEEHVYFNHSSSWLSNATASLTKLIKQYHLDGIDINYEHFRNNDTGTFSSDIGKLIETLKENKTISFASIAPFNDDEAQNHYQRLWKDYKRVIDYVNFQFYSHDEVSSVDQFIRYFETENSNYPKAKILVSYNTEEDASGGLPPGETFYKACQQLKAQKKLHGVFVWCADTSKANSFRHEVELQKILRDAISSQPSPSRPVGNGDIIRNGNFEQGQESWRFTSEGINRGDIYQSNEGSSTSRGYYYARVTNRKQNWQGLEQDITGRFRAGTRYHLIAYVRASGSSSEQKIMATIRLEYPGSKPDVYKNVGSIKTTCGQDWKELTGDRSSLSLDPQPKKIVFYIEGPDAGVDLFVKSVQFSPR